MNAEQVIEEMTQEGYEIYRVTVFKPLADCFSGRQWIPLDELVDVSGSATVWLWGKRADGDLQNYIVECNDMERLAERWKGGWQANI